MRGSTTYDEDCNLQVTTFILDSAPKCTVNVPVLCGLDSTQWVIVRRDNDIIVRGRCDMHSVKDDIALLKKANPAVVAIGVITHEDDFAEVVS